MPDIHIAVTRHVKPGLEDRFDELLRSFVKETMTAQGVTGVHLLRPPTGSESREFGILRSFDDESSAEQFYGSARFQAWTEQVADLVEGQPLRRRLSGLEAFFRRGSTIASSKMENGGRHVPGSLSVGPVVVQPAPECVARSWLHRDVDRRERQRRRHADLDRDANADACLSWMASSIAATLTTKAAP